MSTKWTKGRSKAESSAKTARDSTESVPEPAEKPISLAPLDFEEALKELLRVKPSETDKRK